MGHRVTLLAAAAALLVGAAPAAAHVEGDGGAAATQSRYAQQPIAMPAQQPPEPPMEAAPRAQCRPGSNPEPGMQGRVPPEEVESGRAERGYWCNVTRIGGSGATGGFKVLRYVDRNGNECAYYDTTLLFPTNVTSLSAEPTGVAVLDMSDPTKPVRTDTLLTQAMESPHESLNISVERGLLAAVWGTPTFAPGVVDVYDISQDCRRPELLSTSPSGIFGHESGMALDGRTFYATSIATGHTTAVGLDDPRFPVPLWVGRYNSHGLSLSDDGNRAYIASGDGLVILDVSEIQAREPAPQVREVSRLVWHDMTVPQIAIPVTIGGRRYLVEVDEYSENEEGQITGHGPRVGAARIIDIADETRPRVVSNIRLEVHQRENRDAIADDPGAQSPVQGYAAHYCNVPQRREPGILACSMITSGLRVFDIRDPEHPKEIGYFVAPPSSVSATGSDYIDERANWAMSQPAFVPERGEIWYSDGTSGFHTLRMDPEVWPFTSGSSGCAPNSGLAAVRARRTRHGVRLSFQRRADLPVRVDVLRVSRGRRVIRRRLVARFTDTTRGVTWRANAGPGIYVVRFTMLKDGRAYDTRRIVLRRTAAGALRRRPAHRRRDSCGLLARLALARPVFGGPQGVPLRATYRLRSSARVTVTVRRGSRVVKRYRSVRRAGGRTYRWRLRSRGLRRGDYTVHVHAVSGEDQAAARLTARRL